MSYQGEHMSQNPKDKVPEEEPSANEEIDFHGAAIVDEQGNETEITESMVRKAINDLEPETYPEESQSE